MDNYLTDRERMESFNNACNEIKDLVKDCLNSEESLVGLYIHRDNNSIRYGTLFSGMRLEVNTISMLNENSLKTIYDLLKDEYKDSFELGFSHDVQGKTFLKIFINEKVLIQVYSSNPYDVKWFRDESDELYGKKGKQF